MKKLTRLLALVLALTALTALVSAEAAYTFRTSKENRVVTENGEFTRDMVAEPVLITSIGQSADVSMLDALMKKVGATYTFNATAAADEVAKYKTVIIAAGASGKGLRRCRHLGRRMKSPVPKPSSRPLMKMKSP
jgi:hypothetical protein